MTPAFTIRRAEMEDSKAIYDLICELAVFERAPDAVVNSPQKLADEGWGENPLFVCWVAELNSVICGMALCYIRYSTWKGPVLYLEDLIVSEKYRNQGMGKALFDSCINYAKSSQFHSMVWQVLDWNTPAIDFYKSYGAALDNEWVNCTLSFN